MKNKGQIHTIEAVISIAIVGIIVAILFNIEPKSRETTQLSRKLEVYETLKILDLTQNLRFYAINGNSTKIEEMLHPYIKFNFRVTLFNLTSNTTQIPTIDAKDVAIVSYIVAGSLEKFNPVEIRVYLW